MRNFLNVVIFVVLFVVSSICSSFVIVYALQYLVKIFSYNVGFAMIYKYGAAILPAVLTLLAFNYLHLRTKTELGEMEQLQKSKKVSLWVGLSLSSPYILLYVFSKISKYIYVSSGCHGGFGGGITCNTGIFEILLVVTQMLMFIIGVMGITQMLFQLFFIGVFYIGRSFYFQHKINQIHLSPEPVVEFDPLSTENETEPNGINESEITFENTFGIESESQKNTPSPV